MKRQAFILIIILSLFAGRVAGQCVTVGSTQTICQGGTTSSLGGAYINSTTAAVWSSDVPLSTFSDVNDLNATWTPPAAFSGTATLTLTATAGCTSSPASTSLIITVKPTVGTPSAPSGTTTLCQGAASTPYTTSASDAVSYTWSVTGSGNTISGTGTTGTVTWAPGFSGTATVGVTATGCGTSSQSTTTVTVTPTVGTPSAPSGTTTLCQGAASTPYTTSASDAVSYTWSVTGSGNTISGTGTTGTVTWAPGFSGTATVGVTATGCGTSSQSTTTVTVTPTVGTPSAPSGTTTLCQGAASTPYTTSASDAVSYTWSVTGSGNTISGTGTTGTVTWAPGFSGTATVGVTATGCGTSSQSTTTVTVTPTVGTPSAPSGTTTLCQGAASTPYTTSASDAVSYTWSVTGSGNTISGTGTTGTVTWAPGFSGTATVGVTATGCGTSSQSTTTVTVTPTVGTPSAPSGTTTLCQGAAPTPYTTSASDVVSYTWSVTGSGNTISGTGTTGTVTWAPGFSGTATVGVTATGCGTSSQSTTTVTVTPTVGTPSAPSGTTTLCQGAASTPYTTSASDAVSYTWSVTGSGNTISGTGTTGTVTWAPGFSGTATVGVTATGCGTSIPASTIVTVNPTSVGGTVSSAQTICYGTSPADLTLSGNTGNVVRWESDSNAGFSSSSPIAVTSTTLSVGTLTSSTYFRAVVQSGTCPEAPSASVKITVHGHFSSGISGGTSPICYNSSPGTFTASGSGGDTPYTYQWFNTTTGSISGATNSTYNPGNITSNTGYYCAVTSNSSCGTVNTSTTSITVNPQITLTGVSQSSPVCSGSGATIDLTGLLAGSTSTINYTINGVAQTEVTGRVADGFGAAFFSTVALTPANNGKILQITSITNETTGCSASFTQSTTLIVNTANVPSLTGPSTTCINSVGNVYTTDPGMTGYTWNVSAGGSVTAGGTGISNSVTVTWNTASAQTVSVNYTNTNGCTGASPTVDNITVNPLPTPGITGTASVCVNSSGKVYTTETGMTNYIWSIPIGEGTITSGGTGSNMAIVSWTAVGNQQITVNYTNTNGCTAASATVFPVLVNPLPVPTITGPSSACVNSAGNIYTTESTGMSGYTWSVSPGGIITGGAGTNSITVTWNTVGAQSVSVNYTNSNSCTAASPTVKSVTINLLPVPTITGTATPLLNTTGNVYTTESTGMSSYLWTVSSGGSITGGSGTSSITVTWDAQAAQTVSVNYTNTNGCTAATPTVYNVTVNSIPVATNVTILGNPRSGLTLNSSYIYSDADGDPEGTSTYQWYTGTSSGGAGPAVIPSATSRTYKLTDAELGEYIGFSVTPVATFGSNPGSIAKTVVWVGPVINDAPVASSLFISGSLNVNGVLTGHYIYSDTEGDVESGSTYQWYSANTLAGTYSPIPGETGIAHSITMTEQGKYFEFHVVPKAATGTSPGTEVSSSGYGPANTKPYADNVTISGTAAIGSALTGSYNYHDVDGNLEGTSTYQWLRNGTVPITGATGISYLLTTDDEGNTVTFEVTPVSATGYPNTGAPVSSAPTATVFDPNPAVPVASQVCVEGIRTAGQILRGKYLYTFYRDEGISTYQWYRNGVPIPGANGIQYTLVQADDIDSNADISFEVTPVSTNHPPKTGIAVRSNPLARITLAKDEYSTAESNVTLTANVMGGVFSGPGVSNGIFSPKTVGSTGSPYTIGYFLNIVNTSYNCSQQASQQIIVNPNVAYFNGFNSVYCHDSGPDIITVSGVPTGSTIIGFSLTNPNGIVSQSGFSVTVDPGRIRPGNNADTLYFSYNNTGIFYKINQSFVIDSVGTAIRILNLNAAFCKGDPKEYISIEGAYPAGGSGLWTGDLLSNTKPTSAYADPGLVTAGHIYPVTYQYVSPDGCYSSLLSQNVTVNPLPNPTFNLNPTYNIDGGAITLTPFQNGGTFSGNGVSGNKLFPDIAGTGSDIITYSITDANNCSANLALNTTIRKAQGTFTGIPSVICYSDTTYNIKVTGLPAGITINNFVNAKNSIVYSPGATIADYNVPAAGAGLDSLVFSYKWDGINYNISETINIDSLGQVVIKNLFPNEIVCDNLAPFELFTSVIGGVFTGPVAGDYLDPTKATGATSVSYTYTNQKTGCSAGTTVPFEIYPAPKVSFVPLLVCIRNNSDTTFFKNNTTSSDSIQSWLWSFADIGGSKNDTRKTPGYLYKTGGLHTVTLKATTVNSCSASVDMNINLGVKPIADFYWKNDCYHSNDSIMLFDSTTFSSPIVSRTWNFFDGDSLHTILNPIYPKRDTGYLKVQYIVSTSYANCSDTITKSIYIPPTFTISPDSYSQNFETGKIGWVKENLADSTWSFGISQPDSSVITTATAGTNNAWFTLFDRVYQKVVSSSIISPCFDFSNSQRPMIDLSLWREFELNRDGAVLQARTGDGTWEPVGTVGDGIDWFNSSLIKGKPGGDQLGWTTLSTADTRWQVVRHTLDELKGAKNVKFRIAYGSDGTTVSNDGIAFNDIWIGERTRRVLLEHFTNNSSTSAKTADQMVNTIVQNKKEDVINIQYHTNFPGDDPFYDANPGDAGARILFYGLSEVPYSFIDGGNAIDFANSYDYKTVVIDSNDVTRRSLINPGFNILLNTTISGGVLSVSGQLTALEDTSNDILTLYIVVTEKTNSGYPAANGETAFNDVFRKFIPDAGGITLKSTWTIGEVFTIPEQVWLIENIKSSSDIEVVAFIQDNSKKQLYQAASEIDQNILTAVENPVLTKGTGFALYPNPTVNKLTIVFGAPLVYNAEIKIYDVRGVIIATYKVGSGSSEFNIENLGLGSGFYLLRISAGGVDLGFKKFIVSAN